MVTLYHNVPSTSAYTVPVAHHFSLLSSTFTSQQIKTHRLITAVWRKLTRPSRHARYEKKLQKHLNWRGEIVFVIKSFRECHVMVPRLERVYSGSGTNELCCWDSLSSIQISEGQLFFFCHGRVMKPCTATLPKVGYCQVELLDCLQLLGYLGLKLHCPFSELHASAIIYNYLDNHLRYINQ